LKNEIHFPTDGSNLGPHKSYGVLKGRNEEIFKVPDLIEEHNYFSAWIEVDIEIIE
jgi:hypothetical protein